MGSVSTTISTILYLSESGSILIGRKRKRKRKPEKKQNLKEKN
jgi:hypothetical protein